MHSVGRTDRPGKTQTRLDSISMPRTRARRTPDLLPGRILGAVLFIAALTVVTYGTARGAAHPSRPYFTDLGQYNYATFLMDEGNYAMAAREFSRLIEEFPASPLLPEAQLGRGEAFLKAGEFKKAEVEFRLFLSNFSDSELAPKAARGYMTARTRLRESVRPASPKPPLELAPRSPRLRAVQVMFFNGRSYAEIDRELERLVNSGVNTVIVRAFHNRGDRFWPLVNGVPAPAGDGLVDAGVYFRTDDAPVVADILPGIVERAHAHGLKVFAWMTTRYADYGIEGRGELACTGYDLEARTSYRCKGLDVFNDRAVDHIVSLYDDLAKVEIDGVLFQDDLVLRHTEGFGPVATAAFERAAGVELDPEDLYIRSGSGSVHYTPLFWRWATWKNRRLLYVAGRVKEAVRARRPGAKFAINLMYENLTNPAYALAWLSQDLDAASRAGFDYYSIMAYHRQMSEELGRSVDDVASMIEGMAREAAARLEDPSRVLMKLQTIDWNTGEPLDDSEVVALIRGIRGVGGLSLAVVPYRVDFPFYELSSRSVALGAPVGRTPASPAP